MYLYICYFAGYPYGGISYSILGPNIPFLLLAMLALMLLLTQVHTTKDVLFISPLLTFSRTGGNDAYGEATQDTALRELEHYQLCSQHFCFCRPFSFHKTLTLLTMGNPPI